MLSIPLVTLLLALAAPSTPAAIEPRDVVRRVAEQIESNYFDPQVATRIAGVLKADLEAGKFDALRDPRELAAVAHGSAASRGRSFRGGLVASCSGA